MHRQHLASSLSSMSIVAVFLLSLSALGMSCPTGAEDPPAQSGDSASQDSYLHLLLRVTREGEMEVTGVSQVPGKLVISDYPAGPYVIEVRRDERIVAVTSIVDPFEAHGFGGPPGGGQEEHSFEAQTPVTIAVKIPDAKLADPGLDRLAITLYRRLDPGVALRRIDPQVQAQLLRERRLEEVGALGGRDLAEQIRAEGPAVDPQGEV